MTRWLDHDAARILAALASVFSALATGVYLVWNWTPVDGVRLLMIATFAYGLIAGVWLPGRYRFVPMAAALVVVGIGVAIASGPVLERYVLINPYWDETSPHAAWLAVILYGPLFALAVALRQRARFNQPTSIDGRIVLGMPLVVILVLLPTMPEQRRPTEIGVVESGERVGDTWHYQLANGATVVIDYDHSRDLANTGGDRGDLLIAGIDGGGPWHLFLRERGMSFGGATVTCHQLRSEGVDEATTIFFDIGLVLPKAPDFEAGNFPRNGRYRGGLSSDPTPFCVTPSGQVSAYLDSSYFPCDLLDLGGSFCDP